MYHDISDVVPDDIYRAASNVLPADFSAQLDYLQCAGYTTITPSQLLEAIEGRRALPQKPIVLTFDDGYGDHYTQAFPILKQHGMTGAFAIITVFVEGGGDYMSWSQIKEMSESGMEIMSHTVTHIDLNSSDDASVAGQLRDSRAAIEQRTGEAPGVLVYPSGEPFRSGTEERQAHVVSMLEEAGYRAGLLAGPSSATQDPARPFALNRLRVGEGTDLGTYATLVGGPAPEACGR
jgi:peptidoglycan/xylan/chitin deacetylase (PgdA/CDA1 family)